MSETLEGWRQFATVLPFSELESKLLEEPPLSFYLISTHFETSLSLEEVVRRINGLFYGDAFAYKTALRGTETVINESGFSWKMRQERIPDYLCDERSDETYCSTCIHVLKKKNCPRVFIVEGVRLNGNRNLFRENWRKIKNAFGVDMNI